MLWGLQVREIYETAIEGVDPYKLTDEDTKKMCLRCVDLEVFTALHACMFGANFPLPVV